MILPALLLSLLIADPQVDGKIWRDHGFPLEEVTAFDWADPPALGAASRRQQGQMTFDDQVREVLESAFVERGLRRGRGDDAEVLVTFGVLPPKRRRAGRNAPPHRGCPLSRSSTMSLGPEVENVLVLELLDVATGQSVWRGRAGSVYEREEETLTRLGRVAAVLLAELPRSPESPEGR